MKYKLRNIIMFLSAFVMVFTVVVLCDPVWASADSYFDDDGYYTLQTSSYDSQFSFYDPSSSPVLRQNVSIPSNYVLIAYGVDSSSSRGNVTWFYADPSVIPFYFYLSSNGSTINLGNNSNRINGFYVSNTCDSSGNLSYYNSSDFGYFTSGRGFRITSFYPVYDTSGDIVRPVSYIPFDLNVLSVSHHLYWNTTLAEEGASLFTSKFYVFPSSFPLSSNSVSIVNNLSFTQLSDNNKNSLVSRGFNWWLNQITYGVYEDKTSIPSVQNFSYTSSSRYSSFNPDSFGLSYSYLGALPVYRYGSDFSSDLNKCAYIDLKQVSRSGVWSDSNLCLVAVCEHDGFTSVARYDFNIDSILSGSVVPPSGLTHFDTYNSAIVTDLQELANFIALCFETSDSNVNISIRNMTAYLQSIPWKQYVSGGVYDGLSDFLPALSNLISSNQLSLPDLTTGLAPFFNSLDITPTGNFANFLGGINTNLNAHLDSLFGNVSTDLSTLKTGLDTSITDLSTEINANTTRIFVPDLVDMSDRLDLSADLLSDKFEFADDIKDNLEDIRDTIEDSSEQPPDWSFTVYNVQLFLVDWSAYQPYRAYVQNILIAIAYILLFKHIYKTIPLNGGDDD